MNFYLNDVFDQWPSLPTCIYNSVILRCSPSSCCCSAVFSPFREVICCWILLFSAFWKLKCLFLSKLHFTSPPQYALIHWINFSWHLQSSSWELIQECPSHFSKSALPSYDCSTHSICFLSAAKSTHIYLQRLQLTLQRSRVRPETVTCVVHLINKILSINRM